LLFDGALRARAPLRFLCDLALQRFNNEFVYAESEAETAIVAELSLVIHNVLQGHRSGDELFMRSLCVFAMYRPLHRQTGIESLLTEIPCAEITGQMLRRTVVDVLEETRLRSSIRRIGRITDAVSQRVRAQYEENPYPRWIAFDRDVKVSVSDWIRSELPGLSLPMADSTTMNVVAGCGTGVEAVSLAAKVAGIRITAVDLSLSSIAYAKRKANELGLGNIQFVQADILELGELQERFDAVLCVGVLHHLREPQAGLRALVPLVHPGGLLKIGLYSERARSAVNAARKIIGERRMGGHGALNPNNPARVARCHPEFTLGRPASVARFFYHEWVPRPPLSRPGTPVHACADF